MRLVDQLVDVLQRLHLAHDGVEPVEAAVVLAEVPRPVLLAHEHDLSSVRSAGRNDPSLVEREGHLLAAFVSSHCDQRFIGRERGIG
jgi:hypothetical protein